MKLLHLRAESKPGECRTPLLPEQVSTLLANQISVQVERSAKRIYSDDEYLAAGAQLVEPNSWKALKQSSCTQHLVLGLKELPENLERELSKNSKQETSPIVQNHMYFAHCFKGQAGSQKLLKAFQNGGGQLWDLEYLLDNENRRVAAFGYWAGYVGAALGLQEYWLKSVGLSTGPLMPWSSRGNLINDLLELKDKTNKKNPSVLVTGAKGRCGRGALKLLEEFSFSTVDGWDQNETLRAVIPDDYLNREVLIHGIGNGNPGAPFITRMDFEFSQKAALSVLVDVTADVGNPHHRLPIVSGLTSLTLPILKLETPEKSLSMICIDHLPTLLPRESSQEFASALFPYVLGYFSGEAAPEKKQTLNRSLKLFEESI